MRVMGGVMFSPRGGSAHVTRAVSSELEALGHDVTLLSGSLREGPGDARDFYAGLDVRPVVFGDDAPLHPSYEDRPGAPDRCFATVSTADYEEHVEAWSCALTEAGAAEQDVLHLHHLTPLNEAARRVAPDVPIVGHLHGTELLMLEAIADGPPPGWTYAAAWAQRMRGWAQDCERLLLLAEGQIARAVTLLGVDPARCTVVPNGFDPTSFAPGENGDRAAFWKQHLVHAPGGWKPGGAPGSVAYTSAELAPLLAGPVLVACGRFTAVKRVPLLVEAWAQRDGDGALVLLGGHPGEWEGEHPFDAIARTGARNVFLAGWHGHDALPAFLHAADALVLASVREQFGLVLVEAMACGLPCLAVDAFGPGEIVEDGRTGWLVPGDDLDALAEALEAVCADPVERRRRGAAARHAAVARYGWPAIAGRIERVLVVAARGQAGRHGPPTLTG